MIEGVSLVDPTLLDDPRRVADVDGHAMLREVASAGAQVRQALDSTRAVDVERIADGGRPRAVIVAGMGGSGIAGHVLQAAAGSACPVPVERLRGWTLPAWVGPLDVVLAVSSSGRTAETLACTSEALRRGARVVGVSAADSPLAAMAEEHRFPWLVVPNGRPPRANLWALSVPLLVTAAALGIVDAPPEELSAVADQLDALAVACGPGTPTDDNPAKQLALELAGSLPMIWGSSDLAGIAAYRLMCQLAENAKYPAVNGVMPEAFHNQVVAFGGVFGGTRDDRDLFADRADQPDPLRLRLVLLRDTHEHENVTVGADAVEQLAADYGVPVSVIKATGDHPLERMAQLCAVGDFASVYLGLLCGVDPTPIAPIDALKARLSTAP